MGRSVIALQLTREKFGTSRFYKYKNQLGSPDVVKAPSNHAPRF
jgi:hypothetical protein